MQQKKKTTQQILRDLRLRMDHMEDWPAAREFLSRVTAILRERAISPRAFSDDVIPMLQTFSRDNFHEFWDKIDLLVGGEMTRYVETFGSPELWSRFYGAFPLFVPLDARFTARVPDPRLRMETLVNMLRTMEAMDIWGLGYDVYDLVNEIFDMVPEGHEIEFLDSVSWFLKRMDPEYRKDMNEILKARHARYVKMRVWTDVERSQEKKTASQRSTETALRQAWTDVKRSQGQKTASQRSTEAALRQAWTDVERSQGQKTASQRSTEAAKRRIQRLTLSTPQEVAAAVAEGESIADRLLAAQGKKQAPRVPNASGAQATRLFVQYMRLGIRPPGCRL